MSFDVAAEAYDRFMGRFSRPLAVEFIRAAGIEERWRVLDVGCGPGALTTELVSRLGAAAVSAIDPSPSFVATIRERLLEVDVRVGAVEELPFPDDSFDACLAQLVVHFMTDPVAGLREMGRVTRPGGTVAACVWDHAGGTGPLATFWAAAHDVDPDVTDEAGLAGSREGHLAELCAAAGLNRVAESRLTVTVGFVSFEDWWEPFTLGVGPAGAYVAGLDPDHLAALRDRCRRRLPAAPFELSASAWFVRAG